VGGRLTCRRRSFGLVKARGAVASGEEADMLEELNAPYSIIEGYIKRTSQGRVATTGRSI
jgi:Holliday junction resolvasome RuvABC ATP-dependent DNA helicase subunit